MRWRLAACVLAGITLATGACRRDTVQVAPLTPFAGDVAAPVSDPPRPESVPPANCATLTAADVGKVVWVAGRPWNTGDVDRATPNWIFYDEVIEDGTPPDAPEDARCKVVKMTFSGALPSHIGIVTVVRTNRNGLVYLSYDGMGPPCGVDRGYAMCTRVSTPPSIAP